MSTPSSSDSGEQLIGGDQDFRALCVSLLEQVGRIILNAALYGTDHRLTLDAVRAAFPIQARLSASDRTFTVDLVDDDLVLNGEPCDTRNRLLQTVAERMRRQQISGFALLPGMTDDEFLNLLDLLLAPAPEEGGPRFEEELERRGVTHLQARRGRWVQVPEGAVFVDENEAAASGEEAPEETAPAPAPEEPGERTSEGIRQILAFLKGEIDVEAVRDDLEEIVHTPQELARLIMEAAAVRMRNVDFEAGESLAEFVVGCLRRTFDELRQSPRMKSRKARKELKKALVMLEKEVLEKLREFSPDGHEDVEAVISQAVDEMKDSLEVEDLAIEYARKIKALESSEKRLLRYLKKHPAAAKQISEAAAGEGVAIPDETTALKDWKPVGLPGALPPQAGGGGALPEEVGVLAVLLTELDRLMRLGRPDPAAVKALNERIRGTVEEAAERARAAIEEIPPAEPPVPPADSPLSSQKQEKFHEAETSSRPSLPEREVLAEIVQQLCQLAVSLNGALAMITYGLSDNLPLEHWEILTTATRSGRELNEMLQLLRARVGLPSTLKPRRIWKDTTAD